MRNRRICRFVALAMALTLLAGIADCDILTRTLAESMVNTEGSAPADSTFEMEIVQDIPLDPGGVENVQQPTQEPVLDKPLTGGAANLPEDGPQEPTTDAVPQPSEEPATTPEPDTAPDAAQEAGPDIQPEPTPEPTEALQAVSYSYTVRASRDVLAEEAMRIIIGNEGSYSSVNANDNGALSVGKIQWHAGRALSMMRRIVSLNPGQALEILGEALYNEITSDSTSWGSRIVDSEEKALLSRLLGTSEGIQAQDDQALDDVSGYLQRGRSKGIVSEGALIYFADIENQNGAGGSGRIARLATEYAGSAEKVTLDIIHKIALEDEKVGRYKTRRERTYSKIKALGLTEVVGPDTGSGSLPGEGGEAGDGSGSEMPPAGEGLHITGVAYPSTYVINSVGYTVKSGVITTDARLTSLTIDIQDAEGASVTSSLPKTWKLSGQKQYLSAYDDEIPFSKIRKAGSYSWIIIAEDSAGRKAELRLDFRAVSSGSGEVSSGSASSKEEPEEIKVSSIELSSTSLNMLVGEKATLTAKLSPDDAQDKSVIWSSSDAAVVTVKNGAVTAVGAGEAIISCMSGDGGTKGLCSVLVEEPVQLPEKMEIVVPEGCLGLGESVALKVKFQPEGSRAQLRWSVANSKLVSVDENGVVTGKKLGITTITVRSENGLKDSLKVKVVNPNVVAAVILEESGTITLNPGQTLQLHAGISPSTAQSALKWSSKTGRYASVDQNGLVTARVEGTTTITVKSANGKKDTVKIRVVDPARATKVVLSHSGTVSIRKGSTLQLSARVLPDTADTSLEWGSSNARIAHVDQNGLVTGLKKGTVTVAVRTANGKKDSVKIRVK